MGQTAAVAADGQRDEQSEAAGLPSKGSQRMPAHPCDQGERRQARRADQELALPDPPPAEQAPEQGQGPGQVDGGAEVRQRSGLPIRQQGRGVDAIAEQPPLVEALVQVGGGLSQTVADQALEDGGEGGQRQQREAGPDQPSLKILTVAEPERRSHRSRGHAGHGHDGEGEGCVVQVQDPQRGASAGQSKAAPAPEQDKESPLDQQDQAEAARQDEGCPGLERGAGRRRQRDRQQQAERCAEPGRCREVERGRKLASSQQQPAPGDRPPGDVGGHHRAQGPALVMPPLDGGVEQDPPAGVAEPQAEFDVFDAGLPIGGGIKAPQSQEAIAAHGSASGPETADRSGMAGVGVVMQKVAEAAHHPRGRGRVVVAAEHRRKLGIGGEMPPDAIDGIVVELHIGVHEQQDLAARRVRCEVAGSGRAGADARAQDPDAACCQPWGNLLLRAVEHHQRLVRCSQTGECGPAATAEPLLPADGGHHQADGGRGDGQG